MFSLPCPYSRNGPAGQILVNQDFPKNHQKTMFWHFSQCRQKRSKNAPATPKNVEKRSKITPRSVFWAFLNGFWMVLRPKKPPKGGAREARAPLWFFFRSKTIQRPSKNDQKTLRGIFFGINEGFGTEKKQKRARASRAPPFGCSLGRNLQKFLRGRVFL